MNTRFARRVKLDTGPLSLAPSMIYAANTKVSSTSVFQDAEWHTAEYRDLPGLGPKHDSWDFSLMPGFPSGFALAGAELAYSMLKDPVESHKHLEWLSVVQELYSLNDFADFATSMGCFSFSDVTNELLEQYVNVLMHGSEDREPKSDERRRKLITFLYKVWDFSPRLSEPLRERPFGVEKEEMVSGISKDGGSNINRTPPIPDEIMGPLMDASLAYVFEHSGCILGAWHELQAAWDADIADSNLSDSGKEKRLRKKMTKILANYPSVWRKEEWNGRRDLYVELHRLRVACILVILAYSGVRASELFSIEEDCCVVDEAADGRKLVYLNTVLRKHRRRGSKDTWVIIDDVVVAIDILQQLTRHARKALGTKRLLLGGTDNHFFAVQLTSDEARATELTSSTVLQSIEQYRRHIIEKTKFSPIPNWTDENGIGKPWLFNTRQFRQTLARFIARQKYGIIAGMRQYKHAQVAIFEGYGSVDTEFLNMVRDEGGLGYFDFMDEFAISLSSGAVAGKAASEIKRAFEAEFKGRAEDYPPSTIAKWLASNDKTLYIATLNLCYFEPKAARCLRNSQVKDTPVLNRCEPGNCDNACITKKHLPLWTAQLAQVKDAIRHPKTSVITKQLLSKEADKIEKIVKEAGGEAI